MATEDRSEQIKIRVTRTQKIRLEQEAATAGQTLSERCRAAILKTHAEVPVSGIERTLVVLSLQIDALLDHVGGPDLRKRIQADAAEATKAASARQAGQDLEGA